MDRLAAARKLVGELVKAKQLVVRRAEILGRDLAKWLEGLDRPPTARELEDWLSEHPQVEELIASTSVIDEQVRRHLAPPPTATPTTVPTDTRRDELVRQLREDPSSAPYLVYSDWLQEQGDPMGELIALGIAVTAGGGDEAVARFERHVKQHDAQLFGGIARVRERAELRWHNGMVTEISDAGASPLDTHEWERLLKLRVCELLRRLSFGSMSHSTTSSLDEVVAVAAPASLEELYWRGSWPIHSMHRKLRVLGVGGLVSLLGDLPLDTIDTLRLSIEVREPVDASALRLPVRQLDFQSCTPELLATLAGAELLRLERLTFSLSNCPLDDVTSFLLRSKLPALHHLALAGGQVEPQAFSALAATPPASRLSSLALEAVELDDARVTAILPVLRGLALAELDLTGNEITPDTLAMLREQIPNVTSRMQERPGTAREWRIERFGGPRFQAAEEIVDAAAWTTEVAGDLRRARYAGEQEYELYVSDDLERYGCNCPSRYQPCKHVVALALIASRETSK